MSQLLVEFFVPIQYTGTLYSIMNEELIKRQLTFLGFVAGTIILFLLNYYILAKISYRFIGIAQENLISLGLTVLQVWLVTKYLHK